MKEPQGGAGRGGRGGRMEGGGERWSAAVGKDESEREVARVGNVTWRRLGAWDWRVTE
jgi:hypothetical protein